MIRLGLMISLKHRQTRRIYLAFEFEKDAPRRATFISQSRLYCQYYIKDLSLPSAVHDSRWQREALKRIKASDVVIIILGPDTHNAPGVHDELSIAGQARCPVVQLMPQKQRYGLVGRHVPVCVYRWVRINEMLNDPSAYGVKNSENQPTH